ncbi:MAG: EF-hand domain-containing protein [Rhodospirillaceae bacterium]|nr:EF-hand domain-containing protein [Rhodospirillaceae bacterium]
MKSIAVFAIVVAFLSVFTWVMPTRAEPVPSRLSGVWSLGNCDGDSVTIMVNSNAALVVEKQQGKATVAVSQAEWHGGSMVLTMMNEGELLLPPMNQLEECDSLPGVLPVLFAEMVAVFGRIDEINDACLGDEGITAHCVAGAFSIIDITGDGRFSHAEISRAVRAAGFFVGHGLISDERKTAFVPVEELYLAQVAATALGPFIAANVIQSYDFDGDGFVSLAEFMQDRSPQKGLEGALANVATSMAPEALSAVMKSLTGLAGLFK